MKTKRLLALVTLLTMSCAKSIEKLAEEHDARAVSEGSDAVLRDLKREYEAHPSDPRAAYLYARQLPTRDEQRAAAERIVREHPDFVWGHDLLGTRLFLQHRYEEGLAEMKRAAALAPDLVTVQTHLAAQSRLVVLAPTSADQVAKRIRQSVSSDGGSDPVELLAKASLVAEALRGDNFESITKYFVETPVSFEGAELLALTADDESGATLVRLFVQNRSAAPFRLEGGDFEWGDSGRCFTQSGREVTAKKNALIAEDKTQCRACPDLSITISPGRMGRPHAYFETEGERIEHCAFRNIPTRGSTVIVRFPKANTTPEESGDSRGKTPEFCREFETVFAACTEKCVSEVRGKRDGDSLSKDALSEAVAGCTSICLSGQGYRDQDAVSCDKFR
jgi:hypothetical protein